MKPIINWEAPTYKVSFTKILIFLTLIPVCYYFVELLGVEIYGINYLILLSVIFFVPGQIYKKSDPDASGYQLAFYQKLMADYCVQPDKLIITFGKKKKIFYIRM